MNNLSTTLPDEAFLVLEYYEWQSTLSEIPGVPKYSYQVINADSIFVLSKLVEEVRKYVSSMFDPQLNDLTIKLLPLAHLSPLKAIEYGVIPEEFKVLKHDKGFVIQHKILRAFIPGVFSTMQQVNEILARLLIGNIQAGEGNCFYKLQPMILQEEFETKFQKLLSKPIIESTTTDYTQYFSPILANIQFEEGFSGISSNVFTSIQSIEDSWVLDANKAVNIVFQEKKKLFQIIAQLSLSTLSNWKAEELEFDSEYIAELRNCYPELNKLTDQLLIDLFDEYQAFVNHGDLWDASREEEFFFYLLGKMASRNLNGTEALNAGVITASYLLNNVSETAALKLGKNWSDYNKELVASSIYIAEVMQFLNETKNTSNTNLQGNPGISLTSLGRLGRKYNGPKNSDK